eukprot:6129846-Ditylum_brightwellii.AAC.1
MGEERLKPRSLYSYSKTLQDPPNQLIASGRQSGGLGVGDPFFTIPAGNQSSCLVLQHWALAPLTPQTTSIHPTCIPARLCKAYPRAT